MLAARPNPGITGTDTPYKRGPVGEQVSWFEEARPGIPRHTKLSLRARFLPYLTMQNVPRLSRVARCMKAEKVSFAVANLPVVRAPARSKAELTNYLMLNTNLDAAASVLAVFG